MSAYLQNTLLKQKISGVGLGLAFLWIAAYILIFSLQPFSSAVNLFLLNFITVSSGLVCAVLLTRVVGFYEPEEPSRSLWQNFALGLWSWALADLIWSVYNQVFGEVPAFSPADLFWAAGYIFFTLALIRQFQLILFERSSQHYWIGGGIWIGVLLTTTLIMFLMGEVSLEQFFAFFYPVADFAVGVAALWLAYTFRCGTLARPWLGLFGFVVADSLYLWATLNGLFDWVSRTGWITLFSELIYVIAYLFLAWGALSQYLTLRYGATLTEQDTKPLFLKSKNKTAP
jgi:hypothetical protein